jgi:multidrug efflux pump
MNSRFFIDRPIFAWVIALFILVLGGVAITQLPVAQYPTVAPPSIVITTAYPGASAKVLDETVGAFRHRAGAQRRARADLHGVGQPGQRHRLHHRHLRAGHRRLDLAQVEVQNRLSRATPRLPQA